jgi:tape measure domain-containing protein
MATSRKDVELALRVTTDGAEGVKALAGGLHDIADEGSGLASTAERMAALAAETKSFRQAEAAAAADVKAAKQAYQDQKDSIDRLKASYQATGGDAAQYRREVGLLRVSLVESKIALREKQDALNAAANAAKNAAGAERALADQVKATASQQVAAAKTAGDGLRSIGDQLTQIRSVAAAALGGQLLGGLAGQISQTADQYKNLAARIKLTTGEGAAFNTAFEGVFAVAQRTNTAIEATGTLFTKVLQSGKALGLGVADALRLTEAINQATQLSGASAESANAALIQLVQGLQSGVLRGDEFNSVMEQAPRLALALADGLGVTTGELRKMSEAGKLTSATVIAALQGQSAVLQSEFDKLPATVGRAIQNLSTSWTQYVGEVDKANGISKAAAGVINSLAHNLGTLATVLTDAGKAALAYKAIELARLFLTQAESIGTATAATAANTAATRANTAAKEANAVAGAATAESAGKLAGIIGTIKLAGLVGVLTNLRDIGTAIGEGIAKWAGYGKSITAAEAAAKAEEAATRAAAAAKAALAQQLQIAADRALGLTVESRKLVDEFDGLRLKGESATEALEKLNKSIRIGDIKSIKDAGAAFDALGLKGELSAEQIRDSWAQALKSIDLGVFLTQARAGFDTSEQGARRFAAAMEGALHEAITRAGLDFQLITTGMGAAAKSSINDVELIIGSLDRLKKSGADTAQVIAVSLGKAIANADSQKAVDAVRVQIESVRRVLGDKIADGFLDQAKQKSNELKDTLDRALPGINSLREAYKQLGLEAPEDLKRVSVANKSAWDVIKADGTAGANALQAAFARYAQSALDASGATGSASRETTQEMLKAEAAAKGLAIEFDNTGRVIVRSSEESSRAIEKTTESIKDQTAAVNQQAEALEKLYDRYRLVAGANTTADGFAKNADGSAAGTFSSALPLDKAQGLVDSTKNGQKSSLTVDEAKLAFKQAQDAFDYMQKLAQQAPGVASPEFMASITALYNAAKLALEKVLAQNGQGAIGTTGSAATGAAGDAASAGSSSHTVNINLGGAKTAINTASAADSSALVNLLQQLGAAKGTSA